MKDMNARANIGQLFATACAVEETGRDGFLHAGCVADESACESATVSASQTGAHDDHLDYSDSGYVDAHGDHGDQ